MCMYMYVFSWVGMLNCMCGICIYCNNSTATAYTLSYHIPTQKFKTRHIEFYVSRTHTHSVSAGKRAVALPCLALFLVVSLLARS